jgi:hypothetical protein
VSSSRASRTDIAQRHFKEMVEKDLASLRSDLRAQQSTELQRVEKEMAIVEKRVCVCMCMARVCLSVCLFLLSVSLPVCRSLVRPYVPV